MRFKIKYIFAPLLFLFSLHVYAEYKTTDFTQEEYQMVIKTSGEYTNCLNETAISQVESQSDVRIIADYAMKQCASILELVSEHSRWLTKHALSKSSVVVFIYIYWLRGF